ncbi:MAG: phage tail terminator family protein [Cetobacterium sp.]
MIYKSDIEQSIINSLIENFPLVDVTTESIFQNLNDEYFFIDISENSKNQNFNNHEIDREFLVNIKYWNGASNVRGIYGSVSDSLIEIFGKELLIIPYLNSEEIGKENPVLRGGEREIKEVLYNQEFEIIDSYLNFIFNLSFIDSVKSKDYKYEIIDNLDGEYKIK